MTTAERVVQVSALIRKIEEASAKGFRTKEAIELVSSLDSAVSKLVGDALKEFWAVGEAK